MWCFFNSENFLKHQYSVKRGDNRRSCDFFSEKKILKMVRFFVSFEKKFILNKLIPNKQRYFWKKRRMFINFPSTISSMTKTKIAWQWNWAWCFHVVVSATDDENNSTEQISCYPTKTSYSKWKYKKRKRTIKGLWVPFTWKYKLKAYLVETTIEKRRWGKKLWKIIESIHNN